ncbi:unnamed protein product [Lathyrus oleraceus]|uniref:J domain-containing protein n=1 Tax=Pisum sativum TaxID=3888 RepID=A0A9D4XWU5_PEA|nr:uncharacterized J domain-containing protein C63.13 [Pisum sativum]KAI5427788.1 hypothetical protein KIW84_032990 [Pisum sativum]
MTMQSQLLVGPISIASHATAVDSTYLSAAPRRRRHLLISASSSSAPAFNGGGDHYTVLGVARSADVVDIKRAYRNLALKYHPDVSKDSHASDLFKNIRHAYEVLSNETTRIQYDRELQSSHKPYQNKWSYGTEFEDDEVRSYRRAYTKKKMHSERYWEYYNVNEDYYSSEADEEEDEGNSNEERGSFIEVLRSAFLSLLLFQTLGARISLTFSSLTAVFDNKLDAGYKVGYVIAWILGGRGGIMLTLFLSFLSWIFGKTSSSVVALFMVAMWVGSSLASYAPVPQGALLTLIYMSIKLQSHQI